MNHTDGHVVAHNRISHVADGISYTGRDCDLYGNDIRDVTDDGLEPDYGYANVRMWENRIVGSFNHGISFQPQYCGPWYIVRNEVMSRRGILKPNVADRFVLVNNTLVGLGEYAQGAADLLMKSVSRNNLWILARDDGSTKAYAIWWAAKGGRGSPYSMAYQPVADARTDVDYDGFDWDRTPEPFWWHFLDRPNRHFATLEEFAAATGIERHGRRVRKEETFAEPDLRAYAAEAYPSRCLTLKPGCNSIDAGQPLPNLSDRFEGSAPDLGAYELGRPLPHYGPREAR